MQLFLHWYLQSLFKTPCALQSFVTLHLKLWNVLISKQETLNREWFLCNWNTIDGPIDGGVGASSPGAGKEVSHCVYDFSQLAAV